MSYVHIHLREPGRPEIPERVREEQRRTANRAFALMTHTNAVVDDILRGMPGDRSAGPADRFDLAQARIQANIDLPIARLWTDALDAAMKRDLAELYPAKRQRQPKKLGRATLAERERRLLGKPTTRKLAARKPTPREVNRLIAFRKAVDFEPCTVEFLPNGWTRYTRH